MAHAALSSVFVKLSQSGGGRRGARLGFRLLVLSKTTIGFAGKENTAVDDDCGHVISYVQIYDLIIGNIWHG
ncbi:hypothetical protein Nepgr_013990 [Nepenthes gracilis]|uniref:Uncharacterized protein n=1 Tax=Nepenthes gracilis TaxID=150966 RepID=A0AAD3XPQ4_NEPGR|nr:hypothetical protein Nepgr_013990 [Nepenthes gracilis]